MLAGSQKRPFHERISSYGSATGEEDYPSISTDVYCSETGAHAPLPVHSTGNQSFKIVGDKLTYVLVRHMWKAIRIRPTVRTRVSNHMFTSSKNVQNLREVNTAVYFLLPLSSLTRSGSRCDISSQSPSSYPTRQKRLLQ